MFVSVGCSASSSLDVRVPFRLMDVEAVGHSASSSSISNLYVSLTVSILFSASLWLLSLSTPFQKVLKVLGVLVAEVSLIFIPLQSVSNWSLVFELYFCQIQEIFAVHHVFFQLQIYLYIFGLLLPLI